MSATLEFILKELNLHAFLENYQSLAEEAIKRKLSYIEYLESLAQIEISRRVNQMVQRRLKDAGFPTVKTLDTFDFSCVKSLKKEVIYQLADGHFTNQAKNLLFFGGCGTGKTHLSIAIGRELCLKKFRVYFDNVCHFINLLQEANHNLALHRFFKKMEKYDLIILDELGYVPFDKSATDLLFQFIAQQYERRSLLITTNLAFSQWDQIFKDKQTTVAAIDRLIHHSYVFEFSAESFRLKSSLKKD